jgi:hypothetical protein
MQKWGEVILKNFSRTTTPKRLRFTQKFSGIVQIQIHKNHGPQGSDGATILKKHFT